MQYPKCSLKLYTDFLIANQNRYSGLELAKVSPVSDMHHDSVTRFLAHSRFTPTALWRQTKSLVRREEGYLVGDDTLLDKRFSKGNELAKYQYSGNEHRVVNGIVLVNLLWTQGEEYIPVDYRVYRKEEDDKSKNDHFRDMLRKAKKRGFKPAFVLMDAWYGSVENLKYITRELKWHFLCNLKGNRKVSLVQGTYIPVSDLDLSDEPVRQVWLKEYGFVLVSKIVDQDGDITYLATDDLMLRDYDTLVHHWKHRWKIEEFHKGIKQTTGIEKCSATRASSQHTHIFAAFIAFVKLETRRIKERTSWYEQKAIISRMATKAYLTANA